MQKNKLISVIVPVYNESPNIEWFCDHLTDFLNSSLKGFSYEVILINDGSNDDSLAKIKKLISNKNVSYLSFSRNFGKEAATTAGLHACKGDAAIMIDADGQHPVELIPKFIEKWEAGSDVVVGVRKANTKEGAVKKYGSKIFYKIINSISDSETVPGSTDFRLVDRKVIDEFNTLTEHNRITRGLIDWLGFKRDYVDFVAPARKAGEAAYSSRKLVKLAMHAFVSQTTKPLQLAGYFGAIVMTLSFLAGLFLLIEKYALGDPLELNVTGAALVAIFISFLVGVVLICQWLLALYVESIHNETQNRPLYVIAEKSE